MGWCFWAVFSLFGAILAQAQNTFIKVETDPSGVGGRVFVNGSPGPMYSDSADPQPLQVIPATGRLQVDLGDNTLKRLTVVMLGPGGQQTMTGVEVQAYAARERPNNVRVPGPNPPIIASRSAGSGLSNGTSSSVGGTTSTSDGSGGGDIGSILAIGIVAVVVLAGIALLIARELGKGTGGGTTVTQTVHGWPTVLLQRYPWLVPEGKITSGGMGTLFIARNKREHRRRVAVKVLHPQLSDAENPEARRFLDEARLLRQIDGAGLAPKLFSMTGELPGPNATLWFEMELLDGWETLRRRIGGRDRRTLRPEVAIIVLGELARQVARLHAMGVAHRDLSPENIMVNGTAGELRLIDFGLAKWTGQTFSDGQIRSAHLTQPGEHVGKPRYCAPEQWFDGLAAAGPAADWYAVGVMGWEMVTGAPPYDSPDEARVRPVGPDPLIQLGVAPAWAQVIAQLASPTSNTRLLAATKLPSLKS